MTPQEFVEFYDRFMACRLVDESELAGAVTHDFYCQANHDVRFLRFGWMLQKHFVDSYGSTYGHRMEVLDQIESLPQVGHTSNSATKSGPTTEGNICS